uniref:aspartyl aminopeptidase n=1 Tax=Pinguiococcus pyrenoidosus TaxID=172671 RepID=A0A7R9U6Z2_9STRA
MSFAEDLVAFLNDSWTAFHAVAAAKSLLLAHDFVELDEMEPWGQLQPQGKYFFTRNMSSLVAFCVGGRATSDSGVALIGAHTDSPCPKLKPISKCSRGACSMVAVAGYGGGLWHTWFDRDLTVAGRALVREGPRIVHRLVKIERPILRTSTLAIHLTKGDERGSFSPNLQQHLYPMLATAIKESAMMGKKKSDSKDAKHSPLLLHILMEHLGCETEQDILDFELQLCDTQPSMIGGAANEFIFSGRLDNLCSSYQSLRALVDSLDTLPEEPNVRAIALFDNEEVGSSSIAGAQGPILPDAIKRIVHGLHGGDQGLPADLLPRVIRKSFCVSADMAHAHHPNYPERHDPALAPKIHGGIVLKHNPNQRYASSAVTSTIFRQCCLKEDLPFQEFATRSDTGCGSTIGPITAALTGMRTVDIGSPQLSMHSVREMMGADDAEHGYRALKAFFNNFSSVDRTLKVDKAPNGVPNGAGARHNVVESQSQGDSLVTDGNDTQPTLQQSVSEGSAHSGGKHKRKRRKH